jgi:hypothetical protein
MPRQNGDHIVGLLSVFTYDPLCQWSVDEKLNGGESEQSPEAVADMKRMSDKLEGSDFPARTEL